MSIKKGFQTDHSSTSYEFYAIDKLLSYSEIQKVAKLTRSANPTDKKASFHFYSLWNCLPGGWEPLMEKYYDVMCSESYGWWTLAFAFDSNPESIKKILSFEYYNHDDCGVHTYSIDDRIIIYLFCKMDVKSMLDSHASSLKNKENSSCLIELLSENRYYLKNGDYRLLFAVMLESGFLPTSPESLPFSAQEMKKLPKAMERLLSLIIIE